MRYRHTQTSPAAPVGPLLVVVGLAITMVVVPEPVVVFPTIAFALLLIGIFAVFSRLTVTVADGQVRAAFGWGVPRRTIEVSDIRAVGVVRNRWYHGWGIRLVPKGFMFNVWGLDAVEIELASGRRFRVGTDEPEVLRAAIEAEAALGT